MVVHNFLNPHLFPAHLPYVAYNTELSNKTKINKLIIVDDASEKVFTLEVDGSYFIAFNFAKSII